MLIFGGIVFLGLGQLVKGLRVGVLGPLAYLPQGLLVAPANEGGRHGLTAHVVFLVNTFREFFTGRYVTFGVANSWMRLRLKLLGGSGFRHKSIGVSRSSFDNIGLYHTGNGLFTVIFLSFL